MTMADKPDFLHAINRLAIAQREPHVDGAAMQVYFDALKDLELEFVVAAADRLALSAAWFPKASEWRQMAAKVEAERTADLRARLRKLASPLCMACADTGWEPGSDGRVRRCNCQDLRRLEILGRRPLPALPEAEPDSRQFEIVRRMLKPLLEKADGC